MGNDALHEAIASADREQVESIVESISSQEALHQVSLMEEEQRDRLMSILTPETAAELIEEAPVELAAALVSGQETAVAAAIMEELYSDTQADIVLEMAEEDANLIIASTISGMTSWPVSAGSCGPPGPCPAPIARRSGG